LRAEKDSPAIFWNYGNEDFIGHVVRYATGNLTAKRRLTDNTNFPHMHMQTTYRNTRNCNH
jgi:hypothetical protein